MSDFGADPNPDLAKIHYVAFGFKFAPQLNLKVDQFSTTTADKVYSLTVKIGSTRLKIRVDPSQIPA